MGDRNHLHVCQHCGIVQATASATSPVKCVACEAFTFSEYALNDLLAAERAETEREERPRVLVGR